MIAPIIYILFMGFGYPLLRAATQLMEPTNINAIMFLSGGIIFLISCFISARIELLKFLKNPKLFINILLLALCTCGNMYCFLSGVMKTSSLAAGVFGILSMPFSVIVASIFFKDEREKLKNPYFIIGSIIAIIGSFIFVMVKEKTASYDTEYMIGIILLACTIPLQTFQSIVVKALSKNVDSKVISSFSSLTTGMIFLIISVILGKSQEFIVVGMKTLGIVAIIGIYASFVGMMLTFYIIQKKGVIVLNVLKLIIPPITGIVGYIVFKEEITLMQYLGTFVILLGCAITTKKIKN